MNTVAERLTTGCRRAIRVKRVIAVIIVMSVISACSVQQMGTRVVADALSASSSGYARDDDVALVGAATPFGLKLMESVLEQQPEHVPLLLAAARGFTQYAYVYVQTPGAALVASDPVGAYAEFERARHLYLRARDYALRGLEVMHPGFQAALSSAPQSALAAANGDDIALIYWAAVAWAGAISLAKDDPFMIADLGTVDALVERAVELDVDFDFGALHTFLISYEMRRQSVDEGAEERARGHFFRAVALSAGQQAAPYVALAEAVSIPGQSRVEFQDLLEAALRIEPDQRPEWRLANTVMQSRARMLLNHSDEYFLE